MSAMSLPYPVPPLPDPEEQIKAFARVNRNIVDPATLARLVARVREMDLTFTDGELLILAALDTPARVQAFLNTQIHYNNDHASPDLEETVMSPRMVLRTARAHCFEGALFAYATNYLHGHAPRLMLLEASQDSEHNLVLYRDPQTGRYGCNAHSAFKHLDGRPADYDSLRAMAESYYPYYYSDRTNDPNDLTLVGYSDPFDLDQFGIGWMGSLKPLWDIYYTYLDDTIKLHYLFDNSCETHVYPMIRALKEKWIQMDGQGRPFVSVESLPPEAQTVWHAFWRVHDPNVPRPHGQAREMEKRFMQLTGTTPIDLEENAGDLIYFLEAGYRIEQLIKT